MNGLFDGWIRVSSGFRANCRGCCRNEPLGLLSSDKSSNFTQIVTVKNEDSSL